jgi:antitoxin VapB
MECWNPAGASPSPHIYFILISIQEPNVALSLKDSETDRLAREVAALTGETLTEAIKRALCERLERERLRRGHTPSLAERLVELGKECAALPDFDTRRPDEIVGYDETGMWT